MKLRVKHNSIRLRLTQTEVAQFAASGRVEEAIEFGNDPQQKFIYAIEKSVDGGEISAAFADRQITVFVPFKVAASWADSDDTGIEAEQNFGDGKRLRILIEKDFACLKPRRGEDERDAFPNPAQDEIC
jgi:ribosomal protein S6E (S10)